MLTVLKCKICGGDIELSTDKTTGVCSSCGSTTTFPKIDDEQKAGLFNRGNALRMRREYDKAAAVFERIIEQYETDAEAHWCLALCRYGIEYVQDPNSGERIPTCHRASYDSIFNDVDYIAAIERSDDYTASVYTSEAKKIAELQKAILAISKLEEPFDIFLCYKETSNSGSRTKDSVIAQEIYYELTNAGYKVFFSRITLEDKLGSEYEPYIFAALNSAKVMLVIGTSVDNFNSPWVKNEWIRFLSIMKADRKRLLIPCYRDIDPYSLPDELAILQSQDMSKIGFIQDITRGIRKVLDYEAIKTTPKYEREDAVTISLERLIKNGNTYLGLDNYPAAEEVFNRATKEYPEDHRGWWGLMICKTHNFTSVMLDQSTLNTWFSYVKQLATTQEFSGLEKIYIDYTKKVSDLDAKNEIVDVNNIINAHTKKIQDLQNEIEKVKGLIDEEEHAYKQTLADIDRQICDCRNRQKILETEYKSNKRKNVIIGAIYGGAIILFLLELSAKGLSLSLVFSAIVIFGCITVAAKLIPSNSELNMSPHDYENALSAIPTNIKKYDEKRVSEKNYCDRRISVHESTISNIHQQIISYQNKIDECEKYLGLGNDRIAELFFAQRCAVFGVKQNIDETTDNYRRKAYGGKTEESIVITCPACNNIVSVQKSSIQNNNSIVCGRCGTNFEVDTVTSDRVEKPYEVTCPSCSKDFMIDKEILNSGSTNCPTCGSVLEFD